MAPPKLHTLVLVRTPGRAGSTLMMQLLASSPLIAFDRHYPYEVRHLSYLLRAAQVVTRPMNARQRGSLPFRWDQTVLADRDPSYVGPLPARSELLDPERYLTSTLRALYTSFSEELRRAAPGSTHYAEKVMWDDVLDRARGIAPVKVIHGVRDPRDQMVSIMRFNEKRGTLRFGWRSDDDQLSFAERFCLGTRRHLEKACQLRENPDEGRFVVRYEDLVTDLAASLERLSDWLGVALDASVMRSQRGVIDSRHATSLTTGESVGRWRTALEPDVKALFERELGDCLRAMGW